MFDFSWFSDPSAWAALGTLTLLEIILGIDNIVFISILSDKLPKHQQALGRNFGLALAMITRLMLLGAITWIMSLKATLFSIPIHPILFKTFPYAAEHNGLLDISGKSLILLFGGAFLIWKATKEIHHKLEASDESHAAPKVISLTSVLLQIALVDMVFSIDSIITAAGMAEQLSVMMLAVIISVGMMILAAKSISTFVSNHPSVKILALSFLILIGTALIAEGLHFDIPKGYIYFAMAFSLMVEIINLKASRKKH